MPLLVFCRRFRSRPPRKRKESRVRTCDAVSMLSSSSDLCTAPDSKCSGSSPRHHAVVSQPGKGEA
ncbi:hypothetical protein M419DRAFT_120234 [Trichoderma reesei RUT C-30]|uniref:Uncharacterized protein n=1 Tax=Hypocrea jecorina (strain ATCC 56765 / BCRC 32924 / NRRL 11460 / Rut C-30) TaxID=1344414 RepID=A0A024S152_HYPJR|nr:hypothetical protein M419DRAFT_120234 [Trichoderma reesei RUT C-30]